jgi:hypothetical protein
MESVIEASAEEQYRAARLLIEEYARFLGMDMEVRL